MRLIRFKRTEKAILGVLKDVVGGTYFTMENALKAIPNGVYVLALTHSPKFKTDLPLIVGFGDLQKDVPASRGIRIHSGNSAADSEGCVLLGNTANLATMTIGESKKAIEQLVKAMRNNPSRTCTLDIQEIR